MTPDICLMCTKLPNDLKCTLHGGHMTAIEVSLRHRYEVVDGQWIEPERPELIDVINWDAVYATMSRVVGPR
jgi:hypothetical protein